MSERWLVVRNERYNAHHGGRMEDGWVVVSGQRRIAEFGGDEAAALLCAAARDLLEALEDFRTTTCDACSGSGKDACRGCGGSGLVITGGDPHAVRAAIAKARGGSSSGD